MSHFPPKDTNGLKSKRAENDTSCQGLIRTKPRDRIGIKADLKPRNVISDEEGHFMMTKGSSHHKGVSVNVRVPRNRPQRVKRPRTGREKGLTSSLRL